MARHLDAFPVMLFRCDASARVGFGHAVRSLALADACRATGRWDVVFAMSDDRDGVALVERRGYPVVTLPAGVAEGAWLEDVVASRDAAVLVLDVRTELPVGVVHAIRERGITVVTVDDPSERRREADLAFYPPVPQLRHVDWTGFEGRLFAGWEWIALRPDVAVARERRLGSGARAGAGGGAPTVVVTMGGSDPARLTLRAMAALDSLEADFTTIVLVGPSFAGRADVERFGATARRRFDVRVGAPDFIDVAAAADLAIASFGVTAYELAALGVPAIHLCLTEDHAQSADALAAAGASRNLGVHDRVSDASLAREVAALLERTDARRMMSERATALVDGKGAARIVNVIEQYSRKAHATSNRN